MSRDSSWLGEAQPSAERIHLALQRVFNELEQMHSDIIECLVTGQVYFPDF